MNRLRIQTVAVVGVLLSLGATVTACNSSSSGDSGYFDECEPEVSSSECYATRRDPDSDQVATASALAARWIEEHPIEEELWDWRSGVLMFALTELYRVTGDETVRDYYKSWLDFHIAEGYDLVWSDSCPPAITAVALLAEEPNDDYEQVVLDVMGYLDDTAPRTAEGGISHNGILGKSSVWLDSLFMFGMVLNRWGELSDPDRLDMHAEQIGIFADVLQDDNGFMRHAQDWPGYDETLYWGRGNSWVVASLADYLRIRVEDGESDARVRGIFTSHVAAILGTQDEETGLWWSIMDRPGEIYLETSGSALFAYGVARAFRYGILGDAEREAALSAIDGVKERIVDDEQGRPVVTGTSLATDPWSFEEYAAVPLGDDVNYGVGAVILALIETSGLSEE